MPADRLVLAFYGVDSSSKAAEGFFNSVVDLMTSLGYPPDKLGTSGAGRNGKVGDFRRGLAALRRSGYSDVDGFSLRHSLPGARITLTNYSAAASFSRNPTTGCYGVVAVPSVFDNKSDWLPAAKRIVECLRPSYGIGFERSLALGPVFYALGICYGGDPVPSGDAYEEGRTISRWSNIGMHEQVYRQGLLRYVYRWNFLTQPQLDRNVGETSLAKWVDADPERGVLSIISDGVWLWEVQQDQLEQVRDQLHDAGAIFDWRKYCNVEPHIKTKLA